MTFRRGPERIPVFTLKLDVSRFRRGDEAVDLVRADDGHGLAWMRHDPGVGELIDGGIAILGTELSALRMDASSGEIGLVHEHAFTKRRPSHGLEAETLALVTSAVIDRVHVEEAELDLVGHERLVHA